MMDVNLLNHFTERQQVACLVQAQTTYLRLEVEGQLFRVDFVCKVAARLKSGAIGLLSYHLEHPILLPYNESGVTVYILSRSINSTALFEEVKQYINAELRGYNDWRTLLIRLDKLAAVSQFKQNISDGSGMLLEKAPVSVAKGVMKICALHGAKTYVLGEVENLPPNVSTYGVLFIGSCYVIARDFQVRRL